MFTNLARRVRWIVPVAGLLVAVSVPADTVELLPTKDNTLYEPVKQENYADASNGAGVRMFSGSTKEIDQIYGYAPRRRAVLAFDIAGNIPAGATIDSVQLTMYCTRVKRNTAYTTTLHRLLADWGEGTSDTGNQQPGRGAPPTPGDTTWQHTFYPDQFWVSLGGDYAMTISASASVGGQDAFYSWGSTSGMVADVQGWLDDPSENYGWVVIGDETQAETAKVFATRENTDNGGQNKPKLVVNYTPGEISGACCRDEVCTVETPADCGSPPAGVYQGDGTSCAPNPCVTPTGACCADDGTCTDGTLQTDCNTGGGTYQGDASTCATVECEVVLTPFVDALPIPVPATPTTGTSGGPATYELTMKEFQQQLHSELAPTTVWGFDDGFHGPLFPGPTIEARTDQPVTVHWINDINDLTSGLPRTNDHYLDVDLACVHGAEDAAKTVTHLHGGHVPSVVDGYPEFTFLPGQEAAYCVTDPHIVCTSDVDCPAPGQCDGDGTECNTDTDCAGHGGNEDCELCEVGYTYPNNQRAGYLWYHDHSLGITRLNVYMGLAGLYFVRDDVEDALTGIPSGEFEIPLVLQDRKFNPDGTLQYPSVWQDHWFGDKIVVNGKVWPYLDVKQGKYRFRVLNGSGSRVYTLSLNPPSGLLTFTVIGDEGGLLEAPVNGVGQLTIGPGERYDVVVDFGNFNLGDEIFLENSGPAPFPNGIVDETLVMKFSVTDQVGDFTNPLPGALRPIERLQEGDAVISRDFRLKKSGDDGCGRSNWLINDLGWDDITEFPDLGTTEIWRFINDSGVSHPMHMHLVFFQILDREGFTTGAGGEIIPDGNPQPPPAEEAGWKDTAMVGPNQILRVIVRFEDYKGLYAYHCHILEHEDHEMMRQFHTIDCGDAVLDPTELCDDGNTDNIDGCSAGCDIEEFAELSGTATGTGGGRVDLTVSGELISANTSSGQTAADVAQALADAINANANLQALGVTATAVGNRVVTTGDITSVDIRDNGLSDVLELSMPATRLWWGNIEGATGYDLVRGSLNRLLESGGDYADPLTTETCLANDRTETFWEHTEAPAPGEAAWYLLRSQPGGTYDTGEPSQVGSRDAEIDSSGNGCP